MQKRIAIAVLLVSMIGCAPLKERFGTGEETPELKAARSECRSLAGKEAAAKQLSPIKREDYVRVTFDACMEKKGYNKYGRKVK